MNSLYDKNTSGTVEVSYPGVSTQDVVDFCEYFQVSFHSLTSPCTPPEGLQPSDVFRVASQGFPVVGYDITYASVISWRAAQQRQGERIEEGGVYALKDVGEVTTIGKATSMRGDGTVLLYRKATGELQYLKPELFFGIAFDQVTKEYQPNTVFVRRA